MAQSLRRRVHAADYEHPFIKPVRDLCTVIEEYKVEVARLEREVATLRLELAQKVLGATCVGPKRSGRTLNGRQHYERPA